MKMEVITTKKDGITMQRVAFLMIKGIYSLILATIILQLIILGIGIIHHMKSMKMEVIMTTMVSTSMQMVDTMMKMVGIMIKMEASTMKMVITLVKIIISIN